MVESSYVAKKREGFDINYFFKLIGDQTNAVKSKLSLLQAAGSEISIGDMFEMQFLMNQLSQMSEMSNSLISATNSSISSMARNLK